MAQRKPGPAGNQDYVEHGSERHAMMLGLRIAEKGEALEIDGYTLEDRTAMGPQATEAYIREVLRQKVAELKTRPGKTQSDDPWEKNYAPPMWKP